MQHQPQEQHQQQGGTKPKRMKEEKEVGNFIDALMAGILTDSLGGGGGPREDGAQGKDDKSLGIGAEVLQGSSQYTVETNLGL